MSTSVAELAKKAREEGLPLETLLHLFDPDSVKRIKDMLGRRALLVRSGIRTDIDPDVELAYIVALYMGWLDEAESTREVAEGDRDPIVHEDGMIDEDGA